MWTQLQAYHDQHFDKCIIALQEKYYGSQLGTNESLATFISFMQKLARQLIDLGQLIFYQHYIGKVKCSLPLEFDPLLLAWDSVHVADRIFPSFQARFVKAQHKLCDCVLSLEAPLE